MQDFLKSVRFKILVGVLAVMMGFMIMAVYTGGNAPLISQVISIVTEPAQRLSAHISTSVTNFFNKYLDSAVNYEENQVLRKENNDFRQQLVDYERIKHEYEQLQKISDVRDNRQDLTFEPASVISREHANPFSAFTIDKGSLNQVKLHDPVMSGEGSLVGYISEVGLSTAKVVTILDINVNVGASNVSTRDIGNVTGTVDLSLEGLCRMEYLPRDSETKPGQIIVTSGGSLFPKDLLIGEVTQVHISNRGNSLEAVVRPATDISVVKDVFVITHFAGQGDTSITSQE